jgi:signal transduction histidine kinase
LIFKVKDTGIGIHDRDKDKLFKLFGKLKVKSGINQHGVGLGLTICKKLVE